MYRWLAVLRFVLVANTVALNIYRDGFEHPIAGGLLVAFLVAWTCLISWVYHAYRRRTTAWLVADMVVAVASVALTAAVKNPDYHATVPGFWIMGSLFAWAIHWRLYGGFHYRSDLDIGKADGKRGSGYTVSFARTDGAQ